MIKIERTFNWMVLVDSRQLPFYINNTCILLVDNLID